MIAVPREVNICPLTCTDPDVVHHHPIDGAEGYHEGAMTLCEVKYCIVRVAALLQELPEEEEALNAIQQDLVKEAAEIAEWWLKTAQADAERTVPKAVEYGAADFDLMGQFMVALIRDKFIGADEKELMQVGRELAATFYLIGKMGRAVGAYSQGMRPSDDTIFDTRIYAMMWQRIRETGSWISNG